MCVLDAKKEIKKQSKIIKDFVKSRNKNKPPTQKVKCRKCGIYKEMPLSRVKKGIYICRECNTEYHRELRKSNRYEFSKGDM